MPSGKPNALILISIYCTGREVLSQCFVCMRCAHMRMCLCQCTCRLCVCVAANMPISVTIFSPGTTSSVGLAPSVAVSDHCSIMDLATANSSEVNAPAAYRRDSSTKPSTMVGWVYGGDLGWKEPTIRFLLVVTAGWPPGR